jgi:hypothetical protein
MQHGAAPQDLGWFALVLSPLGKKIDRFLAGNFQANCFEGGVHKRARAKIKWSECQL